MRIINPEHPIESSELDGHVERDRGANWSFFWTVLGILAAFAFVVAGLAVAVLAFAGHAQARDVEGKHAGDPLTSWFEGLASGRGLCCSFADGTSIRDVDWDTVCHIDGGFGGKDEKKVCQYRIRLHGQWVIVPDSAVVTVPNKLGPAVVWPYMDTDGGVQIRCFMPGAQGAIDGTLAS